MSRYLQTNGITIHCLETAGTGRPIVLLPGVSANVRAFDAITRVLAPAHRVVALDLRGRGLSDKPESGYGMADHAADVLGVLDALALGPVILGGHSFGGLLTLYMAAHHPDRATHLLVLDAAAEMHPEVRDLIAPSLARLGVVYPSADDFLGYARGLPTIAGAWDADVERYYRYEIEELPGGDGTPRGQVRSRTSASAVAQSVDAVLAEPWQELLPRISHPALLLNAPGGYGPPGAPPVLLPEDARRTAARLPDCRFGSVPGNHMTMMFGDNAVATASAILEFLRSTGA